MPRLCLSLTLVAILIGCTGPTYTIEAANVEQANERAARYCSGREATARLEQVRRQGDRSIQVYRCVSPEQSADASSPPLIP
ncbi:MAG TPA: hypothetical protein VF502_09315 [Stellaceae bacterium]